MNIKEYRLKKNMSQEALSKEVGVTAHAICQYERNKRTPNIIVLKKIADALGCKVDDLIK